MLYLNYKRNNRPNTRGWPILKIEISRYRPSIQGRFSIAHFWDLRKRYLQFTKIKVSNAIMNIPKAIRSLKSYFIRTTSHLCMMEGQRPCSNTIVPCHYGNISHINVQLLFPAADYSLFVLHDENLRPLTDMLLRYSPGTNGRSLNPCPHSTLTLNTRVLRHADPCKLRGTICP